MAVRGENSLFFASGIDNTNLEKGTGEAVGLVASMGSTIAKLNPFAVLATGATAAFAAIAKSSYEMMREFEHNMKTVETISDAAQNDLEGISNQVFALSKISPDGPAALADAYYQLVSAGYDGAAGMELLAVSAQAATAGVTDTETAADGITTVLNAFKLEADQAGAVADALFTTVKLGKTSFEELSTTIAQVAPLAASAGFSFEEILAAVATLTKQGTPTSQAMTQIRAALQATSKVLGDGAAEAMTLQNAFQAISDQAGGSQNKLTTMLGSVEAVGAVLALTGRNAEGAASDLEQMGGSAGAAEEAFKRMASSNKNELTILENRIKATTKTIGNITLEMVSSLARAFNDVLAPSEELTNSYEAQKLELFKLEGALHQAAEGTKEFNDIRDIILKTYPEFIGEIDAEKASTEQLLTVLGQVNDAYLQRYKYARREQELMDAMQRQGDIEISIEDARSEFDHLIAQIRASNPEIELDLSLDPEELLKQVRDQANTGFIGQQSEGQQVLQGQIYRLNHLIDSQEDYREELEEQKRIVQEIADQNNRLSRIDLETKAGQLEAITTINAAMKEAELSQFVGSGVDEIEKAIQARLGVISQFDAITATDNLDGIKKFLESENEEIAKFAKERARMLNTDYEAEGTGTDDKKFTDILKDRENQYKEYTAVVNQLGQEAADKQYQDLLEHGKNYGDYLQRQLDQTTDAAKQTAIAVAAELSKITLNRGDVSAVSSISPSGPVDMDVNDTSINYIQNQIRRFQEQLNAASKEDRPDIQPHLDYWKERLEIARGGAESEKTINEQIRLELRDLGIKGLIDYRKEWREKIKIAKEAGDDIAADEAKAKVEAASQAIGDETADTIRGLSDSLGEASDMFREFGEEDLANTLSRLADVGKSMANMAASVASGNPLAMAGSAIDLISKLFWTDVDSMTHKFEAAIKDLERAIDKLDYAISRSVGTDRIEDRQDAIEQLQELEEQATLAAEAEKEAEKRIKYLGITIGKKGKGSGTDAAKLEELTNKAEEARREVDALRDELNELYTGTTATNITDSIIQGFLDGKMAAADFADDFEGLMKNAMLQAFQLKYMEEGVAEFYKAFAEAGSDSQYTESEIAALRRLYDAMISGAQSDIDAINEILESSGMGALGSESTKQREGLSGAISSITEDTANILAGTLNAMRLDVRQGVDIAIESSQYLSEIAVNTRYNRFLESIDNRLGTMERGFQEFQAQG